MWSDNIAYALNAVLTLAALIAFIAGVWSVLYIWRPREKDARVFLVVEFKRRTEHSGYGIKYHFFSTFKEAYGRALYLLRDDPESDVTPTEERIRRMTYYLRVWECLPEEAKLVYAVCPKCFNDMTLDLSGTLRCELCAHELENTDIKKWMIEEHLNNVRKENDDVPR